MKIITMMQYPAIGTKQKIAFIAPVLVLATMLPIFQGLAGVFDEHWRIAWGLGLTIYWLIWGAIFPLWLIGVDRIRRWIRPQPLTRNIALLVLFPLLMSALYRFIPGMQYDNPEPWVLILFLATTFGNGFFEELLWRGVYMELFPDRIHLRMIWPSIGFALWHYAPGHISPDGHVWGLVVGAGLMGFYWNFLAKKTGTIWWGILAHVLGGMIMIV
jgi:membrane protease YdiL (CAAX protease family)